MTVWRVSRHPDLDGGGASNVSGRWHRQGSRVIYCAPNPATALLEVLVHLEVEIEDLPPPLPFLEIDVPDDLEAHEENLSTDVEKTRDIGENWLKSAHTALLRVPTVLVPATVNILINPVHADAKRIKLVRTHHHPFDRRFLKTATVIK